MSNTTELDFSLFWLHKINMNDGRNWVRCWLDRPCLLSVVLPTMASCWIFILWGVMVHVLLCGLLCAHGKVPKTLPHCWAHWPIQTYTLSWALELAVMPELTPGVLGKWRTTAVWVIWSNDPRREAASLCLCQLVFIHFKMWGSALA